MLLPRRTNLFSASHFFHLDLVITRHGGDVEDHFLNCRASGSRYSYHGRGMNVGKLPESVVLF